MMKRIVIGAAVAIAATLAVIGSRAHANPETKLDAVKLQDAFIPTSVHPFYVAEELGFFNLLLTVTGVGPKVALAIVGSRPTADLQLAIMQQDQAVLVSIPGIGKKLAERVIVELKEKVAAAGIAVSGSTFAGAVAAEGEVVGALQALGYSLAEARTASRAAMANSAVGTSLEDRVKAALRVLARD